MRTWLTDYNHTGACVVDLNLCPPAGMNSLTRYDDTTDWQKKLTAEQYVVTREKGTELVGSALSSDTFSH